MNQDPIVETQPTKRSVAHWVTLARSVLALTLGLGLILEPDKTRPMLINFIGMFWLMGGLMSLRWSVSGERARRISVVVGVVGIVAGALILGRFLLAQLLGESPIILLLGAIITLTGVVHVFEGFRTGTDRQRRRSWVSTLLGIFEIVLGVTVLLWRDDFGSFFYALVTIWAFMAALILLREGLRQRALVRSRSS
ncbi:MAG TPA: DUF308 domain-containing protein [Anaerolineae bacterium]|nr:DUF308 domain-containing protein [Anaerolineae bacterium]